MSNLWRKPGAPIEPAPPPVEPDYLSQLPHVLQQLGWDKPDVWAAAWAGPMRGAGIVTPRRIAGMLGNSQVECGKGRLLEESFNYRADRLRAVYGARATPMAAALCRVEGLREADQPAIANIVYGGPWGLKNLGNKEPWDGWTYRGRGALQVTGRANYERLAGQIGVEASELIKLMSGPAGAADTACRWWMAMGCNAIADSGDIAALRRRINGGETALDEVRKAYADALRLLEQ